MTDAWAEPAQRMPSPAYFRAVALDFDGTLAHDGRVDPATLAAVGRARARGVRVVLVTGRILDELRAVFPEVDRHVDAIVAENGAVVATALGVRPAAAPVDPALGDALSAEGVQWRAGEVLLACAGTDEVTVLACIRRLGLDCQLVRNRGELMVLPPGVTKGTGLADALADLGLSHHNAIGVGDAENDLSLLESCELGIAVANSVESLRAHADVVLAQPDGAGVAELLNGALLAGAEHVHPRRWQLVLGVDDAGTPVTLPASQINVVVAGGTGQGKSYLAGLMAEQLVGLGYSLFVLDPEGDHVGLGQLRDVLVITADHEAATGDVIQYLRHVGATVVLDLSGLDTDARLRYVERLPVEIEARRAATGLPQWVLVDEAHGPLGRGGGGTAAFDPATKGYLLVTWRPDELSPDAVAGVDAVIAVGAPQPAAALVELTAAVADMPRAEVARLLAGPSSRAVLAWRHHPRHAVAFNLGPRSTPHRRHDHKYGTLGVEVERRFYFRTVPDAPTGAIAGNLAELEAELASCDEGVIRHHCPTRDFSRWISSVFHDDALAGQVEEAEASVSVSSPTAVVEEARVRLVAALQARQPRRGVPMGTGPDLRRHDIRRG